TSPAWSGCYDRRVSVPTGLAHGAVLLLVAGMTAACTGDTPRPAAAQARQEPPPSATSAVPRVEPIETGRSEVPSPVVARNPFRFERRGGTAPRERTLPPADSVPELPFPVPPPLRLLG